MKEKKQFVKDVCIFVISLISIAVFFNEVFQWMMYV